MREKTLKKLQKITLKYSIKLTLLKIIKINNSLRM